MQPTEHWSREAERRRMMDRLAGDKVPERPFWPGRPGMWTDENPIEADGALRDLARQAQGGFLRALTALGESLTSFGAFVDRDLAEVESEAREALSKISELRTRIHGVNYGEVE